MFYLLILIGFFVYVAVGMVVALAEAVPYLLLGLYIYIVRPSAGGFRRWWAQRRRWQQLERKYRHLDPPRRHPSWGRESFELERPTVDEHGIPYLCQLLPLDPGGAEVAMPLRVMLPLVVAVDAFWAHLHLQ